MKKSETFIDNSLPEKAERERLKKMKITDAFWEKRNLGVDVTEITCEITDSREELKKVLAGIEAPYSVCKVPGGAAELLLCAQEQGYQVIEMSIGMEGKTKELALPRIYQRFASEISIEDASSEEIDQVLRRVESGSIFKTDRIALDPYFGEEFAGKRYANWTRDLLKQGAHLCIGYYKDKPAAFGVNKEKENAVSDAVLGGALGTTAGVGLGFLSIYANLISAIRHENKKMCTHVSSNNPAIIHLHIQFGFQISEMQYVLIKHR